MSSLMSSHLPLGKPSALPLEVCSPHVIPLYNLHSERMCYALCACAAGTTTEVGHVRAEVLQESSWSNWQLVGSSLQVLRKPQSSSFTRLLTVLLKLSLKILGSQMQKRWRCIHATVLSSSLITHERYSCAAGSHCHASLQLHRAPNMACR